MSPVDQNFPWQNVQTSTRYTQQLKQSMKILKEMQNKLQQIQNQNSEEILSKEQKKILKLFSYDQWSDYMKWIQDKLEEVSDVQDEKLSAIEELDQEESRQQSSQRIRKPDLIQNSVLLEKTNSKIEKKTKKVSEPIQNNFLSNKTSNSNFLEDEEALLAMQNAKLRKENINLQRKISQLQNFCLLKKQKWP